MIGGRLIMQLQESPRKLVNSIEKFGMLDHQFVGSVPTWAVYVRMVPNK